MWSKIRSLAISTLLCLIVAQLFASAAVLLDGSTRTMQHKTSPHKNHGHIMVDPAKEFVAHSEADCPDIKQHHTHQHYESLMIEVRRSHSLPQSMIMRKINFHKNQGKKHSDHGKSKEMSHEQQENFGEKQQFQVDDKHMQKEHSDIIDKHNHHDGQKHDHNHDQHHENHHEHQREQHHEHQQEQHHEHQQEHHHDQHSINHHDSHQKHAEHMGAKYEIIEDHGSQEGEELDIRHGMHEKHDGHGMGEMLDVHDLTDMHEIPEMHGTEDDHDDYGSIDWSAWKHSMEHMGDFKDDHHEFHQKKSFQKLKNGCDHNQQRKSKIIIEKPSPKPTTPPPTKTHPTTTTTMAPTKTVSTTTTTQAPTTTTTHAPTKTQTTTTTTTTTTRAPTTHAPTKTLTTSTTNQPIKTAQKQQHEEVPHQIQHHEPTKTQQIEQQTPHEPPQVMIQQHDEGTKGQKMQHQVQQEEHQQVITNAPPIKGQIPSFPLVITTNRLDEKQEPEPNIQDGIFFDDNMKVQVKVQQQRPRTHDDSKRDSIVDATFELPSTTESPSNPTTPPMSQANRIKETFLSAADIARQLAAAKANQSSNDGFSEMASSPGAAGTTSMAEALREAMTSSPSGTSNQLDARLSANEGQSGRRSVQADLLGLNAVYLGKGLIDRHDINGRSQVRISCQFVEPGSKNLTVWGVEWNRFEGIYNAYQEPRPSFQCLQSECRIVPVKTDTLVTVNSRPIIQTLDDGTQVPMFSMTIHAVDDQHMGSYRCSAMRHSNSGSTELVYRVTPLVGL